MTVVLVVAGLAILLALAVAAAIAANRASNGTLTVKTPLLPDEVLDILSRHFVKQSWTVQHRDRHFVALKSPPNVGTGCLLCLLFLPLGLVYLLTDWSRGRLAATALDSKTMTEVEMEWRNVGIRGQIERFAVWLERRG